MNKIFKNDNLNPEIRAVKSAMGKTEDIRMFKRYQAILKYWFSNKSWD